jgi:transposase-like protein
MRKSRLRATNQHKLIVHFVAGTTARCVTDVIGAIRISAIYIFIIGYVKLLQLNLTRKLIKF